MSESEISSKDFAKRYKSRTGSMFVVLRSSGFDDYYGGFFKVDHEGPYVHVTISNNGQIGKNIHFRHGDEVKATTFSPRKDPVTTKYTINESSR